MRRTLNAEVNASLVHLLQGMKANARPLHGNWMFTAEKITTPDRGYVGEVVEVSTRAVCPSSRRSARAGTGISTTSTQTAPPRRSRRR